VRVLGSLCRELHSHHCDVECVLDGEPLALERGPAGIRRLFDQLAAYEPSAAADGRLVAATRREQVMSVVITRRGPAAGGTFSKGTRWVVLGDSRRGGPDPVSAGAGAVARSRDCLAAGGGTPVLGDRDHGSGMRPWISLDAAGDLADQLQRQWGRLCHDDWRE